MRLFVTGATGFVGGHLVEAALRRGDAVMGASLGGCWHAGLSDDVQERVELLTWDVRRPPSETLQQHVAQFRPDAFVHLAGLAIPADCGRDAPTRAALETNVEGTRHALQLADTLPELTAFLLASSCHVYRADPHRLERVDENWPLAPSNGYGKTKQLAEAELQRDSERSHYRRIVTRGFQQTGPRQSERLILPEWIAKARAGERPLQVRCLETRLDLIDVRDAIVSLLLLLEHSTAAGAFNIASGQVTSGADLIAAIERCAGERLTVRSERSGPYFNPIADVGRLTGTIGEHERIPLEQTVSEMWSAR